MFRTFSMSLAAVLLLLIPVQVRAGGPARLCLPIAGVTADNAAACAELLSAGMGDKLWPHAPLAGVEFEQHQGQWYALLYLDWKADVKLSDIAAALEASEFSVPRDRLCFFGPVQLAVDVRAAAEEAVLRDLTALEHVKLKESTRTEGGLLVTLVLPENGRRNIFHLLKTAPPESNTSAGSVTIESLPSYAGLCEVMTRHDARLQEVRWSGQWACRMLGSLAVVVQEDGKTKKVAVTR